MAVLGRLKNFLIKANNRRVLTRIASKTTPLTGPDGNAGNRGIDDGITIILGLDGGTVEAALSRLRKILRRTGLMGIDIIVLCTGQNASHQRCHINHYFSFWYSARLLCCPSKPDDWPELAIRMALRAGRARHAAILSEHLDREALSNLPALIVDSLRHSSACSTGKEGDSRSRIVIGDRKVMLAQIIANQRDAKKDPLSPLTRPAKVSSRKQRIGGMATMPSRLPVLSRCLERILPQLDELHLYLNGFSDVPVEARHTNVMIHGMDGADLKDNGKFFGLPRGGDEICMTFDDDIAYPADYTDCMAERLAAYGDGTAIGLHAAILKPRPHHFQRDRQTFCFYNELASDRQVHTLGTGTAAFSATTLDALNLELPTTGMADVWFACAARKAGIRLVSIARPQAYAVELQKNGADSLYRALVKDAGLQTKTINSCSPWPRLPKPCNTDILVQEEQFSPVLDQKFRPANAAN